MSKFVYILSIECYWEEKDEFLLNQILVFSSPKAARKYMRISGFDEQDIRSYENFDGVTTFISTNPIKDDGSEYKLTLEIRRVDNFYNKSNLNPIKKFIAKIKLELRWFWYSLTKKEK